MQRKLYFTLGIGIILYGIAVISYNYFIPEFGLRGAFETEIQSIQPYVEYLPVDPEAPLPQRGDFIRKLGTRPTPAWPHHLRAVAELNRTLAEHVVALPHETDFSEVRESPAKYPFVRWADKNYVLVQFEKTKEDAGAETYYCWCRVGQLPAVEVVPSILWFGLKLCLFFVGALAYWKRPDDAAARRFFILCIVTLGGFMGAYHWWRIAGSPPLIIVFIVCSVLLPAVILHFFLTFPRPKQFYLRRPRLTLWAIYLLPGLFLAAILTTYIAAVYIFRRNYDPGIVNSIDAETVNTILRVYLVEVFAYIGVAAILFLGCIISLTHSYLDSRPDTPERNQVKWILAGSLLAALPIGYTLYLAIADSDAFGLGGFTWPMFTASLCLTLGYGISISRYGMMEVNKALNWGVIYVAVSVAAGLTYTGLVFLGTLLIGTQIEPASPLRQAILVSVSAFFLLVVMELARWRLRYVMDRRLHRTQYQLDQTLQRMNRTVEGLVDPPTLAGRILEATSDLLGFKEGAIYIRSGSSPTFQQAARVGAARFDGQIELDSSMVEQFGEESVVVYDSSAYDAAIGVAFQHEDELTAVLLAGPKRLGQYEPADIRLLTTFSRLGAMAIYGAERHQKMEALNDEVQTMVDKTSEQQRRILALQSRLLSREQSESNVMPERAALSTGGMVGSSDAVQQLLDVVGKVSGTSSAVLIRGESGTGKELLARALHENSPRAEKPFVKVHCAALSPTLLESELFGHVKGAFTGAHRDKAGRFELANGGTLFLDEIGDISVEVQTKLLRVLQEKAFERVGSSEPMHVDVRIIAATHQNLEDLMRSGKFRQDLFYRLNVITVRTPPLRERREDVYELSLHFLETYNRNCGKSITNIDDEALEVLKGYDWPGNIRELENIIERAVVLADEDTITPKELPEELQGDAGFRTPRQQAETDSRKTYRTRPRTVSTSAGVNPGSGQDWATARDSQELDQLQEALVAAAGNKSKAARTLGMPRTTFMSKLKKHGL